MDFFHEKLQDYVKQNGIEGVVFLGYVSDEELVWLYQNTVTYVFPSLSEGFGLPGLEAFCFGAPVASSNATCLPEIYGNAAEYFDPENIKSIEETIDKMLVDKDLRQKLSVAGKERLKKYSWEKMAKQTHEIYMKAIR